MDSGPPPGFDRFQKARLIRDNRFSASDFVSELEGLPFDLIKDLGYTPVKCSIPGKQCFLMFSINMILQSPPESEAIVTPILELMINC